ncbi:PadR family transcriptional regulator [Haloarcula onubensis]|uniref:PadR family transcriptional regulator n=1 Tax=Haloarcula onubensis TaxID=2950539 RepID=A0ABU2FIC3_9EURY|nr:helix-turn-helix transcriptional regulator [Halomicroarcula sp. S3CR25-11]MDS0280505.1 PadR family transcriptional regulator [Halomicroarcula sp. S3CR25-11]
MSGDNLRRVTTGKTMGDRPDERLTPLVGASDPTTHGNAARDAIPESLLASVVDDIADGDIAVDDGLVTQSLDEILLAMIALSDDETHGTGLMEALSRLFDAQLSPGTVYPRLHDLEADNTLTVHELVQTKQYSIDDAETAASQIEEAAYRHFVIGMFLHASLDAV